MEYIGENFTSLDELIRVIANRPKNKVMRNENSSEKGSYDFTGTHSYKEAIELMKNGYNEPLEKIKKGVAKNLKNVSMQKTSVKNDIVGYAPCVPNAILGIPQSMINKEVIAKKSKIVTIVYDVSGACSLEKDEFIDAGIAVLTIINTLEASGYRVSLKVAFDNSSGNSQKVFSTVNLKDWRQPLDLKKMTFPLCHPSMLRRIAFKWLETFPKLTDDYFPFGYGKADSTRKSYTEMEKELRDNKLIKDHEKYINIRICKDSKYNPQIISEVCGLK
jgi:hypothetical protein